QEGVRVGPVSLYTEDVLDLVRAADTAGLVTGVQLVVRRRDGRDGLVLRLAGNGGPDGLAATAAAVERAVHTARPLYPEAVAAGHVHPLSVDWVRHHELAVNTRTGKLLRVLDERPHS
ncbi:phenylacetate--CoA ligase family protein, partial [Kitasatospora sp. NPDC007106]